MKSFASDNYSGIHNQIIKAIIDANSGHEISYGEDSYTLETQKLFEQSFGKVKVLYAFNGTGANVIGLKCYTLPFEAIITSQYSHIVVDECGAPVQSIGCSVITLPTTDGKIRPEQIEPYLAQKGNVHHSQPKVISISQCTELGTVYTIGELKALCDFAHDNGLYVHMDGARIANAAVALGVSLREATVDYGIDIMSFGGTKNGMMIGEAVLIFNEKLAENAPFYQKQSAQLYSKNRFIAAQFGAVLKDELWKETARHSNKMARLLSAELSDIKGISITQKTDANGIFAVLPREITPALQEEFHFYIWDETTNEARLMCSFDTTEEEVFSFAQAIRKATENITL